MKSIGRCRRSQADASSNPGSGRAWMRSRNVVHRSTWRSWNPSGCPRSRKTLGLPVDPRQQGDAVDQLEGQSPPALEVGVEGRRPPVGVHGRPAVHVAHQIEGAPEHRLVVARGDGRGMGHVGPVERLDDPPLADDPRVAGLRRGGRGDPQCAVHITSVDLVDLVLGPPGDEGVLDGCTHTEAPLVHPRFQSFDGDHHRFPTSLLACSELVSCAVTTLRDGRGRRQVVPGAVVAPRRDGAGRKRPSWDRPRWSASRCPPRGG